MYKYDRMKLNELLVDNDLNILQIQNSFSYNEYKELMYNLVDTGMTTGAEKTDSRINFTKLNLARMDRIEKTVQLIPEFENIAITHKCNCLWLILTESWCGDAAQSLPVLNKIANRLGIEMYLILRDENLSIMDKYLTDGTKSIPKLICFDKNTGSEKGTWGPRPAALKKQIQLAKQNNVHHDTYTFDAQVWYNKDKSVSLQKEFITLLKLWNKEHVLLSKN